MLVSLYYYFFHLQRGNLQLGKAEAWEKKVCFEGTYT